MHQSRAPSIAPGTFFVAQSWADYITNMPGFNLRQAQVVNLAGGYEKWFAATESLLADLSANEREAIFGGNAAHTYLLKRGRPTS